MSLEIKKHKSRFTSPQYLKFIREQPCIVCRKLGVIQTLRTTPSHTISRGRADSSDAECLPVCLTHHPQSTRSANEVLIEAKISIPAAIKRFQQQFRASHTGPITLSKAYFDNEFEQWCNDSGLGRFHDGSKRKNRREFNYYQKPT